jgi:hypothetical protein
MFLYLGFVFFTVDGIGSKSQKNSIKEVINKNTLLLCSLTETLCTYSESHTSLYSLTHSWS